MFDYNVIIQIKENQNIKEFCAHLNVLRIRFTFDSPYSKDLLSADKSNNENNVKLYLYARLIPIIDIMYDIHVLYTFINQSIPKTKFGFNSLNYFCFKS